MKTPLSKRVAGARLIEAIENAEWIIGVDRRDCAELPAFK
jgi:hypothetical protein